MTLNCANKRSTRGASSNPFAGGASEAKAHYITFAKPAGMVNGVVTGKLRNLRVRLDELKSLAPLSHERLQDWIVLRAVERDLQVCVEILIDVCQRLISIAGHPPASTSREAVESCVSLGALSSTDPYNAMIGFRNLIVHRYETVDESVLIRLVNDHLPDFESFAQEVMDYVERQN